MLKKLWTVMTAKALIIVLEGWVGENIRGSQKRNVSRSSANQFRGYYLHLSRIIGRFINLNFYIGDFCSLIISRSPRISVICPPIFPWIYLGTICSGSNLQIQVRRGK